MIHPPAMGGPDLSARASRIHLDARSFRYTLAEEQIMSRGKTAWGVSGPDWHSRLKRGCDLSSRLGG